MPRRARFPGPFENPVNGFVRVVWHDFRVVRVVRIALSHLAAASAAVLLASASSFGQTAGALEGTVADAAGGALPGALVTLSGAGERRETVAGGAGEFAFAGLPPGEYRVAAALLGFDAAESPVSVRAGATAAVRLVLDLERLLETVSVIAEEPEIFATNVVAAPMLEQQAAITNVMAVVDNLPGVSVQEGDAYGFDDWSSNVAVRGFQVNLNEAQIGTTIDGFPNGASDYWGGSKANRFVDSGNLGGVDVSQGTADVASRSVEALGGTFNFTTSDPARERTYSVSATLGEHGGQRYAMRVDTGRLFGRDTYAWVSAVRQESTDWMQGAARNERDHLAAKFVSSHGRLDLSSYLSYDDVHEIAFQRIYSDGDFRANPRWDRLIADWPGEPYLNQFYRPGWPTNRQNAFGYLKADWAFSDVTSLSAGGYHHRMRGYGGWLPPFIADVTDDGGGAESELAGGRTVLGGEILGEVRFVDGDRVAVRPRPGCASSYIFSVYGPGGPEVDPACHPGGNAVMSHRHANYARDRSGLTLDHEWFRTFGALGSRLRTGVWYERSTRTISRDWHRILDPRVGDAYDERPYWRQYDWDFPQRVFKWYAEETVYAGPVSFSAGVKQFVVDLERRDRFGVGAPLGVDSDSDVLFAGGVTVETPVDGLELFGGYSQNFKSLSDRLLEVPGRSIDALDPETAANLDVGLRYSGERLHLGAAWYDIDFTNRIFFVGPATAAGPDYVVPGGGGYFNAGGIDTRGFEFSATVELPGRTAFYTAWTFNDSAYIGTGDAEVDAAQGIEPGSAVAGVPDRLWVVSLDRAGPVGAGVSGKYTAARRVSLTTDWRADAYWLVDAYLSFSLEAVSGTLGSAEVSLVGNNLLDRAYLATIAENYAWLGAARTISMNVSVTF